MRDEYTVVLELIRTDFKDVNCLSSRIVDVKKVLEIISQHKLGSYILSFAKPDLPAEWAESLETEYVTFTPGDLVSTAVIEIGA